MMPGSSNNESQDYFKESTSVSLSQRLQQLDEVDRKIYDVMELVREIIHNLDKDKQITRSKMDDVAKKYSKTLDEDILKVINEQLVYMEQLCVGAEHQGSMFRVQNRTKTARNVLKSLCEELKVLNQTSQVDSEVSEEEGISQNDLEDEFNQLN